MHKIRSSFAPSPQWKVDAPASVEHKIISDILAQDFNYLGSGAQCYAFLSEDRKYVLKFFKVKHLTPKNWLKLLPFPGLEKYRFRKIDKRNLHKTELFSSYKMAYENLRDETGVVYLHLNKTKNLKIKVKLLDRMRKVFLVDLDRFEFVLQKKAQLVTDRLLVHLQRGDFEGMRYSVRSLLSQIVKQCQKGYIDRDTGISHNYGFIGDDVIHFDVGRIIYDEAASDPAHFQREILRVGEKLKRWFQIQAPHFLPILEEEINRAIDLSEEY